MRRFVAILVILALLSWLALPVVRAFTLVSARHTDPVAPADLVVEELRFVELAAWTVHTVHGAPAVVLVHGFKTSREEMVPWARFLHDGGYNVLLLDTRGCGKSGGSTVGLGATEPHDVALAVDAARAEFGTTKVAVLGISLGPGAVILAAANDPDISAVIADSAWTDQDFQLARLSFVQAGPIRVPLLPYGVGAVNALVGADVTTARPLDAIGRISPRPILLIHSADDENATTPVDGARRLFAAAGEPKQLWVAPRGGHVGALNAFPAEYRARVLDFLGFSLR
ncbi:MAG: alpha/beta fold hydrolase [Chloroflexota bacterium]